ncbi:MAG: TRAP transporter substrate-binding protein DctP [Synergistales bacterium]|nr:TRAP transporter substrate-binding protein DctP [Synergistales bacterium]
MSKNVLRFLGIGVSVLVIALFLGACLPMDAEAAQSGEKTWRWQPSTWQPSGVVWERLNYVADYITEASGGRIKVTPTAPGMICAVQEQLDSVARGSTPAMAIYPDYFSGKMPLLSLVVNPLFLLEDTWELRQYVEKQNDGRILELFRKEMADYGDIHVVGPMYYVLDMIANSTEPIKGIDDIKGMKFRCGDVAVANGLGALGAAVTWSPGEEIYTNLSTGVIDACTYSGPADGIAMGFHEVAPYWLRKPLMGAVNVDYFIVNGDVWRELPDDLKAVVEAAVAAGNAYAQYEGKAQNSQAWAKAEEEHGVKINEWSQEDVLKWKETVASFLPEYAKDEPSTEATEIVEEFIKEWKPALAGQMFEN